MAKKMKATPYVVGLILVVVLLLVTGIIPTDVSQSIIGGGDDGECDFSISPTFKILAVDKDTGTAVTEATNLWRIKGQTAWTVFTGGTGFAVDPLEELEIVMGITTNDFTDNAYGQMFDITVPCKETPSIEYEVANDEEEGSLTATFLDNDESAATETFVADQSMDVYVKLQAGSNEYFGNPYLAGNPNVICLALNTSEWDTPDKVYVLGGEELSLVSTPIRHAAVASMKDYCYQLPVINEDSVKIGLKLNSDDSVAPATDMTASIYAANYFYNSDTQNIEFGVENEEGTAAGTDAADTLTLDFTA